MKKVAQKNFKEKKKNRVNEERESLFIGVDVHEKNWMVSIVDETWNLKKKTSIPGNSASLLHLIRGFGDCYVKVCYEAGGFGFGLYDDLTDAGINATVIAPSMTPIRAGDRIKTDRRDSENLATRLAKGDLTEICVPDITRRAHREIIRGYDQVKKEKQRVMNQIKSFLKLEGKKPPSGMKANWSRKYVAWLKEVEFEKDVDGCLRFRLDQLIKQYEFLCEEEKEVRGKIDELCELPQYKEKMEAIKENIKGIGNLTIIRLLLEMGDFSRFKNSRKFTSYLGLTPSERSSGEKERRGSLTGYGNRSLRSALVEVSWIVLRHSNSFRHTFKILSYRIGKNKAIVAIARKLAIRLFWIIREIEMIEQAA